MNQRTKLIQKTKQRGLNQKHLKSQSLKSNNFIGSNRERLTLILNQELFHILESPILFSLTVAN